MKFYTLLVLSAVLYVPLKAQDILVDGYIITSDNETLNGKIVVQQHYREVKFQLANSNDFKVYGPENVKLFSMGDKGTFATREIKIDNVLKKGFFEVLVQGKPMSLLNFENVFYLEKDTTLYMLDKKESAYADKIAVNKRYIGILNYLMLDCEKMKSKINSTRLQEESLIKIVQDYNVCINPDENRIATTNKKIIKELGIRAGVMSSDAKVLEPYGLGFFSPYIPGYGVNFSRKQTFYMGVLSSIKLTPHLSFNPEVNYIRRASEASLDDGEMTLDYSFLQFALPVSYNFYPSETSVFSLYGGFGLQALLANHDSGVEDGGLKYFPFETIEISGMELAVFGGFQALSKVGENCSFGIDCRYEFAFRHAPTIKMFNMYCLSIGPIIKFNLGKKKEDIRSF